MNSCSLFSAVRRSEIGASVAVGSDALATLLLSRVIGVSVVPHATMTVAIAPRIRIADHLSDLVFRLKLSIAPRVLCE